MFDDDCADDVVYCWDAYTGELGVMTADEYLDVFGVLADDGCPIPGPADWEHL